jgi:hypothetical protein
MGKTRKLPGIVTEATSTLPQLLFADHPGLSEASLKHATKSDYHRGHRGHGGIFGLS